MPSSDYFINANAANPGSFSAQVPAELLSGLEPRAWLCIGPGFAREEFKSLILGSGFGLVSGAVTDVQGLAEKVVAASLSRNDVVDSLAVLGPLARQEILRLLLADRRILSRTPEVKRLRRQAGFFRRLDFAIQAGRMAAASLEEEDVQAERLEARFGLNPVRAEVRFLARAYEGTLQGSNLWDLPLALRTAVRLLEESDRSVVNPAWGLPEEIHVFRGQTEEGLERLFWDALAPFVKIVRPLLPVCASSESRNWRWERWHTLDDAAESLAECLAREWDGGLHTHAVLIPDIGSVRRSLKRALANHGIPFEDPRDPTRLQWDETLKWALLPLEVAARGFERTTVISWLARYLSGPEVSAWVGEINSRGIRQGLHSYSGGVLAGVHSRLKELSEAFGGRKTAEEVAAAHLEQLRIFAGLESERAWTVAFFEKLWKDFLEDLTRLEIAGRRAPLLFWLERLETRLQETPAPVERLKAESGVRVYRLSQMPLVPAAKLWVLGLPPLWLNGEGVGDYWLSERDRELLSGEFNVRSSFQVREERLNALKAWLSQANEVLWLDAEYEIDGRERESILPALTELRTGLQDVEGEIPAPIFDGVSEDRGSHPRWVKSYGAWRPYPAQQLQLAPLPLMMGAEGREISATALDRYSRCGFQGLALQRWKLWDQREPEAELWPEVRGNILHEAVKLLLQSRDDAGLMQLSLADALAQAWKLKPPRGLLKGERIEAYAKSRLLLVLEAFRDGENAFRERAGTKTVDLDTLSLRFSYPAQPGFEGFTIIGTPDRIEENSDGLFIMDYKTSSALPHGTDMVELGYRLQLPFYALAAQRQLGKPALGVQFVQLTRKGSRSSGIFFKEYNGKEPGKLTQVRSNSKSLLQTDSVDAWVKVEEQLRIHAQGYLSGRFEARPKKKVTECRTCPVSDLCGLRRLNEDAADGDEPGSAVAGGPS